MRPQLSCVRHLELQQFDFIGAQVHRTMGTIESITAQVQQTSDVKALKTSLIDSDKLVVAGGSFSQVVTTIYNTSVGSFPGMFSSFRSIRLDLN